MAVSEINELQINSPSQELLGAVVQTLPESEFVSLTLYANGIVPPLRRGNHAQYLKTCSDNKVMPYSRLGLEFDSQTGIYVPDTHRNDLLFDVSLDLDQQLEVMLSNARGGRFNVVQLIKRINDDQVAFNQLKANASVFRSEGFNFYDLVVHLDRLYGNPASAIALQHNSHSNRLDLVTKPWFDDEPKKIQRQGEYRNWFKQLAADHGTQVVVAA